MKDQVSELIARKGLSSEAELEDLFRRVLRPAEGVVLRLSYGLGCEREYPTKEIAQEFGAIPRLIVEVRRSGLRKLGVDAKVLRQLAEHVRTTRLEEPTLMLIEPTLELVEASTDFKSILDRLSRRPQDLFLLEPRKFEELVCEIWRNFGYEVELTCRSKDGGRDVIAVKMSEVSVRYLIECKRYAAHRKVGVELVRALHGIRTHERATKAVLATTSRFTKGAQAYFSSHLWELEARDFDGVVEWINRASNVRELPRLMMDPSPLVLSRVKHSHHLVGMHSVSGE